MTEVTPTATLKDVANLAGVSQATASRAFNGSTRRVRAELHERVLLAAKKLNYSPNAAAQVVARGQSNVVGLVVHDIADPYFSTIAAGVIRVADEQGYLVTLGSTMRQADREVDFLSILRGQRSRAVILAGSRFGGREALTEIGREITAYEHVGGHVVLISQPRLAVDTVVIQNRKGARSLAKALVASGYRDFGILSGPKDLLTARDRHEGFRRGLADAGLTPAVVIKGAFTRDGGYAAMAQLLAARASVDCVFAVNDVMAVGAMAACRDRGLHLPDDIALAGFDDITTLHDVTPALSTVRLPLEEIGAAAMELAMTAQSGAAPRRVNIGGEVVLRASTPPR